MDHGISVADSYDWLRSTLEHVASMAHLSDADFVYVVFEVLLIDVRSALSEVAFDRCVAGHLISDSEKREVLNLRSAFLALVDQEYMAKSLSVAEIRSDDRLLDIARSAQNILANFLHEGLA